MLHDRPYQALQDLLAVLVSRCDRYIPAVNPHTRLYYIILYYIILYYISYILYRNVVCTELKTGLEARRSLPYVCIL
jgi:hypothetical protein